MSHTYRHKSGLCQSGLWIAWVFNMIYSMNNYSFFWKNEWVNVWVNALIILEITELNCKWLLKEELVRRNNKKKSNVFGKIKKKKYKKDCKYNLGKEENWKELIEFC